MTPEEFLKQVSKGKQMGKVKLPKQSESSLQQNCVRWFDYQYPNLKLNLFSIPNEGQRTARNGARMKAQGRRKGVADMFLSVSKMSKGINTIQGFHCYVKSIGLFIEFKTGTGKQSAEQIEFQTSVENQGYNYSVIRDFDSFEKLITEYLNQ